MVNMYIFTAILMASTVVHGMITGDVQDAWQNYKALFPNAFKKRFENVDRKGYIFENFAETENAGTGGVTASEVHSISTATNGGIGTGSGTSIAFLGNFDGVPYGVPFGGRR